MKIQYNSIKAIALSRTPTALLNLRDITVYKVLTFKLLVSELISNQLSGMSSLLSDRQQTYLCFYKASLFLYTEEAGSKLRLVYQR